MNDELKSKESSAPAVEGEYKPKGPRKPRNFGGASSGSYSGSSEGGSSSGERSERSGSYDRSDRRDRNDPRGDKKKGRKKVCRYCEEKAEVDYLNLRVIKSFLTERGKIVPARITGICSKHQRHLTDAVKRCRNLALVPFTTAHE
jgi:small subunit ribosomal protein S18